MKVHVFDVLPEYYKPVCALCSVNISNMAYNEPKKEIRWFFNTEVGGSNKQ